MKGQVKLALSSCSDHKYTGWYTWSSVSSVICLGETMLATVWLQSHVASNANMYSWQRLRGGLLAVLTAERKQYSLTDWVLSQGHSWFGFKGWLVQSLSDQWKVQCCSTTRSEGPLPPDREIQATRNTRRVASIRMVMVYWYSLGGLVDL